MPTTTSLRAAADLRATEAGRRAQCPGYAGRRRRGAGRARPRFDSVLVDAPCTGTGAWRRRPDAKWRIKPANSRSARRAARPCERRPGQAGRPARLRHLLGAAGGERRPGRLVRGEPSRVCDVALAPGLGRRCRRRAARRPLYGSDARFCSRRLVTAPTASSSQHHATKNECCGGPVPESLVEVVPRPQINV